MGNTTIGEHCRIGPNVLIFDHDHDYKAGLQLNKFKTGSISIGDNVWIGGGAIILRDTEIGDNAVIAAGSIVKGKVPAGSLYVQKRRTEII